MCSSRYRLFGRPGAGTDLLVVVRNRPARLIAAHRLVFQVRHSRRHQCHDKTHGGARVDPRRLLRVRGRPRRREREQRHDRHEVPRSVSIAAFGKQVGGVDQQPCCRRGRESDRQRTITPPRRRGIEERDHEDRRPYEQGLAWREQQDREAARDLADRKCARRHHRDRFTPVVAEIERRPEAIRIPAKLQRHCHQDRSANYAGHPKPPRHHD